jgi:hypothetical protein
MAFLVFSNTGLSCGELTRLGRVGGGKPEMKVHVVMLENIMRHVVIISQ